MEPSLIRGPVYLILVTYYGLQDTEAAQAIIGALVFLIREPTPDFIIFTLSATPNPLRFPYPGVIRIPTIFL